MKEMLSNAHQEAIALRDNGRNDCWQAAQFQCMIWILSRGIRLCDRNARMMQTIRAKYTQRRGR
ncbi:MAG: hypothetical protein K2L94_01310 [Alphaproteobacteria bacterium]|nr:hypothetical protein [Alphaproteobacteria bacterium]